MLAELAPEREMRGPGCDERCQVIKAVVPGRFGRTDLLLHAAVAHEEYGRGQRPRVVVTGRLQVDTEGLAASVDGQTVGLSPTELRLLVRLARQLGQVVGYAELLTACWGDAYARLPRASWMHMLRASVSRLRRRLLPDGDLIVAVYGVGLRLDALPPGGAACGRRSWSTRRRWELPGRETGPVARAAGRPACRTTGADSVSAAGSRRTTNDDVSAIRRRYV